MVRRRGLVNLSGQKREMLRSHLAEADGAVAEDLLRALFEFPLDFRTRVSRAHRFLDHGIQTTAASLKSQFVRMLLHNRHEGIVVESVRIIGEKRTGQED